MRTCALCNNVVNAPGPCPNCVNSLMGRARPSTRANRQAELEKILTSKNGAEVPWPLLKRRIGKVMGFNEQDSDGLDDNVLRFPDILTILT